MILVSGEQTDGNLGIIEDVIPARHAGPQLHLHPGFDEGFSVLEGELAETVVVGPRLGD
jgi:hypothetical protein